MNLTLKFLTQLLLFLILPILLIFVVATLLDFRKTQYSFQKQIEEELALLTKAKVGEMVNIIGVLRSVVATMSYGENTKILLQELNITPTENLPSTELSLKLYPIVTGQLNKIVESFQYISAAAIVNTRGKIVLHTVESFIGTDISSELYFQDAINGQHAFENLFSRSLSALSSVYAQPIVFNNQIIGVAYVVLDLEQITQATIDNINFNETGRAFIISNTGQFLMHSERNYVGQENGYMPWVQEILSKPTGIIEYTWGGVQKIGVFQKVPTSNWVVVVTGVKEDLFGYISSSLQKGSIVSCMMLILLCLTFILLQTIKELSEKNQNAFKDIKKEQELLQQIIADCPILMSIYDDNTNILLGNPALTSLTGLKVKDQASLLLTGQDEAVLVDIFTNKTPIHYYDLTFVSENGQNMCLRIKLSLITYKEKPAILTWGQDISSLTLAVQQAQEYSQAKSNFMSCMSHEIRTPMNAILGMLYLILQTRLTYEQEQYILKIQGAATNLLGIINEILDFSKIEAGRMSLEILDFHLSDLIRQLSDLFQFAAEQKQTTLFFFLSPHIPNALRGDKLRITQILTNLIGNAVKFTHKGRIIIAVNLVTLSNTQATVQFSVKDTGVGMTQKQLQKIYAPFTQADESITRRYGGTGLGLPIAKTLVEMMGSQITVDSTFGVGTTFQFILDLPLAWSEPSSSKPIFAQLKILVVDDNPDDLNFLSCVLTGYNCTVHMAESGQSALQNILQESSKGDSYDLVFLDWLMPNMNGYDFMLALQTTMDGHKSPMIILTSAHEITDLVEYMIQFNVSLFLPKPLSAFAVENSILYALNSTQSHLYATASSQNLKLSKHFTNSKILLVEDTAANIEVASKILANMGCIVDVAVNGQEAVDFVQKHEYALILMDVHMPVMDGLEATKAIRNLPDPKYTKLPIIAMTALALTEEKEACYNAGMNAHIAKPFAPKELLNLLEQYLQAVSSYRQELENEHLETDELNTTNILPPMDGFDTNLGLMYLANNLSMYANQLKQFTAQYHDYPQKIQLALDEQDYDTAKKLAHTIKGVSKMFGAIYVSKASADLEESLFKREMEMISIELRTFDAELQRVLETLANTPLDQYMQEVAPQLTATFEEEMPYLIEQVKQIPDLILVDFGAVLTIIEELDNKLTSPQAIKYLEPVRYAVSRCDPTLVKQATENLFVILHINA